MDDFAGAINAALRIDEGIEPGRNRAARDAAVSQIERWALQAQERVVALAVGNQHGGRQAALPAREPGLELGEARRIGGADGKHFIVARDQADFDSGFCVRRRERIEEDVDAVVARERGEAQVRDDEPLRRELAVVFGIARAAFRLGGHHIDAGLEIADRLIDRESGGDVGIEHRVDLQLAFPGERAGFAGELAAVVCADVALEIAAQHGIDQVAVADAMDLHLHGRRIDADHRNSALAGARQHIGFAGEAHIGAAVAHIDVVVGRFLQRFLHGRRQAGAQRDRIALAVA